MKNISIYETFNGGAVTKIEVQSPKNQWISVFSQTSSLDQTARIFSPSIAVTRFKIQDSRHTFIS